MKPINDGWCCLIDITNVCINKCVYCSRFVRHVPEHKKFFMDLEYFKEVLDSLKDWPNMIGIIGGEPTLHPQFEQFCIEIQKRYCPEKMVLFTTGGKRAFSFDKIIKKTFSNLAYTPHNETNNHLCRHQPTTIIINDCVHDEKLKEELIDNCWVQLYMCPTINPKGGFFCEIAATQSILFDGPNGYKINSKWYFKTPEEFKDQRNQYCYSCGMQIPMKRVPVGTKEEIFSPSMYEMAKKYGLKMDTPFKVENISIGIQEIDKAKKDWNPRNNREDLWPDILSPFSVEDYFKNIDNKYTKNIRSKNGADVTKKFWEHWESDRHDET